MHSGRLSMGWNESWTLAMQVWFTQLVSNRVTLLWGHEGEQLQVEHMETSVLLAGDAPADLLLLPLKHRLAFAFLRHLNLLTFL